ncbi:Eukaryotic translation initiation factor 2-alpha kinase [Folsomia candida]|uniref:non-specific serine/threonine protein kinase n=1 Tax=Folsomia candida TaxID=158441 RepID=A0A226D9G5_FOLCA|nr:Eukaryotic translation initiation factor 2-alpha kinase [Folsomia candida]
MEIFVRLSPFNDPTRDILPNPVYMELDSHPLFANAKEVIYGVTHYDLKKRTKNISTTRFRCRDSAMLPCLSHSAVGDKGLSNITLGRMLGEGAYSTVMSAYDNNKKIPCAIKFLLRFGMDREDDSCLSTSESFSEFANLHKVDQHENLVKVHHYKDVFLSRAQFLSLQSERVTLYLQNRQFLGGLEIPMIQMELCGPSLREWLEDEDRPDNYDTQLSIINDLVSVVNHIHYRGLLHMDIKPDNIFFSVGPETYSLPIKLGDFGLSSYELNMDKITLGLERQERDRLRIRLKLHYKYIIRE